MCKSVKRFYTFILHKGNDIEDYYDIGYISGLTDGFLPEIKSEYIVYITEGFLDGTNDLIDLIFGV